MALSLAGAALITRLINLPLKQLSRATMQVREGEYEAHRLDERARTNEIRAVNVASTAWPTSSPRSSRTAP